MPEMVFFRRKTTALLCMANPGDGLQLILFPAAIPIVQLHFS
jgi:hypothetical protein